MLAVANQNKATAVTMIVELATIMQQTAELLRLTLRL